MLKKLNTITIPQTDTEQVIAHASDVFSWIDPDFENWKTNVSVKGTTLPTTFDIYELTEDKTLAQIFTDPKKQFMTQSQIIEFCKNHKDQLRDDGYGNLFLFKVDKKFFVVSVYVRSVGKLRASVRHLDNDSVWYTECRRRVVIPQLPLESLESESLPTRQAGLALDTFDPILFCSDGLQAKFTVEQLQFLRKYFVK